MSFCVVIFRYLESFTQNFSSPASLNSADQIPVRQAVSQQASSDSADCISQPYMAPIPGIVTSSLYMPPIHQLIFNQAVIVELIKGMSLHAERGPDLQHKCPSWLCTVHSVAPNGACEQHWEAWHILFNQLMSSTCPTLPRSIKDIAKCTDLYLDKQVKPTYIQLSPKRTLSVQDRAPRMQ